MVNIDMCLQEKCESGGCSNILEVGDKPNYVNTNGTSFIGIATTVRADCQCKATNFSSPPECTPGYCYNGGTCIKDEWGDVKYVEYFHTFRASVFINIHEKVYFLFYLQF